ncbi:MAG: hypothetical protein A2001_03245 [Treponema sp. GWC1_61_84]|nr:MAG: hypothetical protein A2001_03245 [Treponema sp. GWC1_61_84]
MNQAQPQQTPSPVVPDLPLERFRAALRIRTDWPEGVAAGSPEAEAAEAALLEFQDLLATNYPAFHAVAERTVLGPYAVLYRWPAADGAAGSVAADPNLPVLLMAHYDVVPAENGHWTVDPFGALVKDGYVWARGAIDTKASLVCALEAAEALASSGFRPQRDLWFAFGGDEERSGMLGAREAAAWLAGRGIRFAWTLDEGSAVTDGILPGVKTPLALVGVEEKGFLDIELTVAQKPGHASRPPRVQAVAVLGRALDRLSRRPFPFSLTPATETFFKELAPFAGGIRSLAMAHPRLFAPLLFASADASPETAALLRTTVAMTQLSGSKADNVLPSEAKAVLNLRILPGWTIDGSLEFVRRAIGDPRVRVSASPSRAANEPVSASPEVARGCGAGWAALGAAIGASFPEAAILPYMVTATTDSRHFAKIGGAVYRFAPLKLDARELARVHGHDERISLENFSAGIEFYRVLITAL